MCIIIFISCYIHFTSTRFEHYFVWQVSLATSYTLPTKVVRHSFSSSVPAMCYICVYNSDITTSEGSKVNGATSQFGLE